MRIRLVVRVQGSYGFNEKEVSREINLYSEKLIKHARMKLNLGKTNNEK